jgi:hypothetical protein
LLREFLESFREYWIARAPEDTTPGQELQTDDRSTNSRAPFMMTTTTGNDSEKELDLSNAMGLSIAVLIAMPNAANHTSHGKGKNVSRPNSSSSTDLRSASMYVPACIAFLVLPPSASQLSRIGWRFNLFRFGPERTALGNTL